MTTPPDPATSATALETAHASCLRAMGMLASGRAWLVFLISLAILVQLGLFAAANWADVLQVRGPASQTTPAGGQSSDEAGAGPSGPNFLQNFWPPARWQQVMTIALPVAGFAGLASAIVLILLAITGIQVNLAGRLPGVSSMVSAFYWSIITAALLFPWGVLMNEPMPQTSLRVPWLFSTYEEIARAVAANSTGSNIPALVWVRFLAWPIASLVAAWIAGARFGKAYWQVVGLAEMEAKARGEQVREV